MHGPKRIDRRNYRSLIIAGIGTIGRSLAILGPAQFALFENVIAVDRDGASLLPLSNTHIHCQCGDVSDWSFLEDFMAQVPGPALFVNLCSGTDNVKIRHHLASFDTAYLDSCASATSDPVECRFSRMMPYTYTKMNTRLPHWLCWGINPGLVEIIARRILAGLPDIPRSYDVTVYEFDRLANGVDSDMAAVGWCPEALVEEIMLSPTLEIIDGKPCENKEPGTRDSVVNWNGRPVAAKIVGHEDIWNLTGIPAVKNGRFYYSLHRSVMEILSMADAKKARSMLYVPDGAAAITGLEQVAVQVDHNNLAQPKTLVWTEDHREISRRFGINAVQYQTAKSLLLAIMLLQRTDYGLEPSMHNASSLTISSHDWAILDHFMAELDINWRDGSGLNLYDPGHTWVAASSASKSY